MQWVMLDTKLLFLGFTCETNFSFANINTYVVTNLITRINVIYTCCYVNDKNVNFVNLLKRHIN